MTSGDAQEINTEDATKDHLQFYVDNEPIEAFDPLFENEISDTDGDLDERKWDGTSVKWITRQQEFQLDDEGLCTARVSITQLPHPPTVGLAGEGAQKSARNKYMIGRW